MREILFRGKTYSGKWIYGDLVQNTEDKEVLIISAVGTDKYRYKIVIPETVGQFTGLTDKNGKKIFEGDILRPFDDEIVVVSWIDCYSTLGLRTYTTVTVKKRGKEISENFNGLASLWDYDLAKNEIIGNIHDNKELLGE